MSHDIDVSANLTFQQGKKRVILKAEGNKVTLVFRKMSLFQIFRELNALYRLQVLNRLWNFSRDAGWLVYFKYGPLRFRVSRPFYWRLLLRLALRFNS